MEAPGDGLVVSSHLVQASLGRFSLSRLRDEIRLTKKERSKQTLVLTSRVNSFRFAFPAPALFPCSCPQNNVVK